MRAGGQRVLEYLSIPYEQRVRGDEGAETWIYVRVVRAELEEGEVYETWLDVELSLYTWDMGGWIVIGLYDAFRCFSVYDAFRCMMLFGASRATPCAFRCGRISATAETGTTTTRASATCSNCSG